MHELRSARHQVAFAVAASPLKADLANYDWVFLGANPPLSRRIRFWIKSPEVHCVTALRLAQLLDQRRDSYSVVTWLARLPVGYWVHRHGIVHHFHIRREARIGAGFLVMHRTGIFVGAGVRIGANCVIHHNVTIGQRVADGRQGVPTIGSRVWIGPGAILTGDIHIGDGVTISAGTVLSKSVPDRCLVAGNPGRVIQTEYDNSQLIPEAGPTSVGSPGGGHEVTNVK